MVNVQIYKNSHELESYHNLSGLKIAIYSIGVEEPHASSSISERYCYSNLVWKLSILLNDYVVYKNFKKNGKFHNIIYVSKEIASGYLLWAFKKLNLKPKAFNFLSIEEPESSGFKPIFETVDYIFDSETTVPVLCNRGKTSLFCSQDNFRRLIYKKEIPFTKRVAPFYESAQCVEIARRLSILLKDKVQMFAEDNNGDVTCYYFISSTIADSYVEWAFKRLKLDI